MDLKLYDTLAREKRVFTPLDPANVRMYVCGPTVYDFAHIGNARPVIVFDVLFRLLRHLYGPDHVTYVRNITDVDDKINARAAERLAQRGEAGGNLNAEIRRLTEETYANFKADVAALGCLPPTYEPRATEFIHRTDGKLDMITLIERLIANGHAYAADGHVLFNVPSMPDYGRLSKRPLDEMVAGARVEVAPYKRDAMDFVLWKPSTPEEPGWDSPWGRGRPGWHIECSAMSGALLGQTFDIHGGGIDLVFPHHENEIAQSRCAFHTPVMANYWMHNGFLMVEGEKMAKSLGNFITIRELRENWGGYGWPGEALRFNMLRTHYRQPIDWTFESLDQSHKTLWDWYGLLQAPLSRSDIPIPIINSLCDDLNTPQLMAELYRLIRDDDRAGLLSALQFLGFSGKRESLSRLSYIDSIDMKGESGLSTSVVHLRAAPLVVGSPELGIPTARVIDTSAVERQIAARAAARKAKNFKEADRIRDELLAMGIVLKDTKNGTTWEVAR
ncbi:MAG: cysteine--tRNA ligase [Xanthobacteraceae bacterium]